MTHHTPFTINLTKHPNGYTFHSLEDTPPATQLNKNKKPKIIQPKTLQSKITNRLMKEIGLAGEIPPIIPEQKSYSRQIPNPIEDIPKPEIAFVQEEQEIDCEVKRYCPLPDSPAKWFSLKELHSIEIQHFPEFFTGKGYKTPELYQTYRNFIVQAYLHNPKRYMTFIACRRVLKGDVNCLLKIYQFLLKEGIINYGLGVDGNHDFSGLSLAKVMQIGKKPQSCLKKMPQKPQLEETGELDTDNLTVTVINKNFSRTYRVYCWHCKLICGIVWYTLSGDEDKSKTLCVDCYNSMDREQTSIYVKVDITKKIEGGKEGRSQSKTNWGLDDNIKLLDFMGSCEGRHWSDMEAQFEYKKNIEDIILQFLQFPITNFDPHQHEQHLTPQLIDYKHEQYITLLEDLYKVSPYAVKTQQADQTSSNFTPSPPLSRFKFISNMLLTRLSNKIEQLRNIETVCEQTNLEMKEQILVNRVRAIPSTQDDKYGAENDSGSYNNQQQ